jgi:hypothetical protein
MLSLTVKHILGLLLLFLALSFDKTVSLPLISLLVLVILSKDWPGFARVGLIGIAALSVSSLFLLPIGLAIIFLSIVVYGWIYIGLTQLFRARLSAIRVAWLGFWGMVFHLATGSQITWIIILYLAAFMLASWILIERTHNES